MSQPAELVPTNIEQGQLELAQLLAIGAVRTLLNESLNFNAAAEKGESETSDLGLEDD